MSSDVYAIGADGVDDSSKSSRTVQQWFDQAEINQWTVQQWLYQAERALTTADHDVPFPSITKCEIAIAAYDAALQMAPGNSEALDGKAYALSMLGNQLSDSERYEEAIVSYDQALQLLLDDDNKALTLFHKRFAMQELEQYEALISSCDQALATNPNNDEALSYRAIALYQLGQYEAAIATYDQILEIHPCDFDAISRKGMVLEQLGRYEEAIASYDRFLAVEPSGDQDTEETEMIRTRKEMILKALELNPDEANNLNA